MIAHVVTILLILIVGARNHHSARKIMSKITEAADATKAALARANASITGIQADVSDLKAKIEALNNSSGSLSAEDQAALDDIQAQANALADKVQAIDDETPAAEGAAESDPESLRP